MIKKLDDFETEIDVDVVNQAKDEAEALISEMRLNELRKHYGVNQTELARKLRVAQANISQLENRADPRISSLDNYVRALGGELEILVRFPDGQTIKLEVDR